MRSTYFLFLGLLAALPCFGEWTASQKEWALGTSAILTTLNQHRHDLLAGTDDPDELAHIRSFLQEDWEISSRADLIGSIFRLLLDGGPKNQIAWNDARVVSLARWGFAVGYLTEAEAWRVIMPTAQTLQHTFSSWQELGRAYLESRQLFYDDEVDPRRQGEWAYRSILMDPASPWRKYAWDLDLGGGSAAAHPEKSAELTIAVHPQGLLCVRLRIPDHADVEDHAYEPYLSAITIAVGCKPRIAGDRYDSKDWILDTECVNGNVLKQNDLIEAHLNLEAMAVPLRREGVTEIFNYIQHEPIGPSSLTPPARDEYIDAGLQWYSSTLRLTKSLPDLILTYAGTDSLN